jgi:hypothetical protein
MCPKLKPFWRIAVSTDGLDRLKVDAMSQENTTSALAAKFPKRGEGKLRLNESIVFANDRPFVLIGGMNVIEDRDQLLRVADHFVSVTQRLRIPLSSRPVSTRPTVPRCIRFAGRGWNAD